MTSVDRSEGVNCRLGGAKACTSKDLGGVPEIVCMTEDGEARIVGDLKTLWAHDLESAMANPEKRRTWLYWGKVFLREAFLFLGLEIKAGDWHFDNAMPRSDWYRVGKMPGYINDW